MKRDLAALAAVLFAAFLLVSRCQADGRIQAEVDELRRERQAFADSLGALEVATARLAGLADSLAGVARRRDTLWLRAAERSTVLRDSILPDTGATREALRLVIAADGEAIVACADAKATCEARRVVAEDERDVARAQVVVVRDSARTETQERDVRLREAKDLVRRSRWAAVVAAVVAALALLR